VVNNPSDEPPPGYEVYGENAPPAFEPWWTWLFVERGIKGDTFKTRPEALRAAWQHYQSGDGGFPVLFRF